MKRNKGISQSKKPKMSNVGTGILYICLPHSTSGGLKYSFPRGKYRASLGMKGLIGKIHLYSDLNEDNLKKEKLSIQAFQSCNLLWSILKLNLFTHKK